MDIDSLSKVSFFVQFYLKPLVSVRIALPSRYFHLIIARRKLAHVWQSSLTRPSITSQRFASTASYQYYDPSITSRELAVYIREKFCTATDTACHVDAQRITEADSIDIDYDTISQTFTFNTFFRHSPPPRTDKTLAGWNVEITSYDGYVATEIGLLHNEKPLEAEYLKLGGFLTTIGKDEKLSTF